MPRRAALLGLAGLLGACASAPSRLHRLEAVPGAPRGPGPLLVELRRPSLPRALDRLEILRAGPGSRLDPLPDAVWAEPLDGMTGRVLAEALAQRLPGSTVFAEGGALSARGDAVVEVQVERFEAGPDGQAVLAALVAVDWPARARGRELRSVRTMAPLRGEDAGAVAAAMSAALGMLADSVAGMVAGG